MNDTLWTLEMELNYSEMSEREKHILHYLSNDLKLEQLTDPSKKQSLYEQSKRSAIFSLRSLDSDPDSAENTPLSMIRTRSLNL